MWVYIIVIFLLWNIIVFIIIFLIMVLLIEKKFDSMLQDFLQVATFVDSIAHTNFINAPLSTLYHQYSLVFALKFRERFKSTSERENEERTCRRRFGILVGL